MTSSVATSVGVLAALGAGSLLFTWRNRSLHSSPDTGIPGPKGYPLIGNLLEVLARKHDFLQWISEQEVVYGPLFTYTMPGFGRGIVINRPEWVEHVKKRDMTTYGKSEHIKTVFQEFLGVKNTLVVEGEEWRADRRMIAPLFAIKNFDMQVTRAMEQILPVVLGLLEKVAHEGVTLDWNNFSGRLAATVFFQIAFSTDARALTADMRCLNTASELLDNIRILNNISGSRLYNPYFRRTEKKDGTDVRFAQARANLIRLADDIIDGRIAQRERGATDDNDFLTSLLENKAEKSYIQDAIICFFFAGQDNITNSLGWSLHELSRHPIWLQRMREEAKEQNPNGEIINYNALSKYPVHLAVFYETMRIWPGVPKNSRRAKEDDILPGIPSLGIGPVKVAKGDNLVWSDFAMMRSPSVWGEDSLEFNPGRHLDEQGQFNKPPAPKFHAFGAGPRLCPGNQLATYEFVAMWAALLPVFDITPVEMKERRMMDGFTSTMEGQFYVRVGRRIDDHP